MTLLLSLELLLLELAVVGLCQGFELLLPLAIALLLLIETVQLLLQLGLTP